MSQFGAHEQGALMITVPELASEALGSYLSTHLGRRFRSTEAHLTELIPSVARLSLECIGNSDALYHNFDVKRTAVDCESLQQCFPCPVRSEPLRAGALIDRKAISSLFVS